MKKIILALLLMFSFSACTDLIFEKPKKDVSNVIVYPSPAKDGYINFKNLTATATISIYTVVGDLVDRFNTVGATATWTYGKVASGVYIAIIEGDDGSKESIKFAIIG